METNYSAVLDQNVLEPIESLVENPVLFLSKMFDSVDNTCFEKSNKFWCKSVMRASV